MTHAFMTLLDAVALGPDPTEPQLAHFGQLLLRWLEVDGALPAAVLGLPRASGSQELLVPLHVVAGKPALYLVSDGAGVTSPPHGHGTWAVIAGLSGTERNIVYARDDAAGVLRPLRSVDVGAGEVLCLRTDAIHATVAAGNRPTFHLHLYGRPLDELPPFASRCHAGVVAG